MSDVVAATRALDPRALLDRGEQRAVSWLVHRHAGEPAVVIGGGMSHPAGMQRVPGPEAAVYISANDHGAKRYPCQYICCLDMIEERLRPYGVPIVSPRRYGDFRIFRNPCAQSGMLGVWLAWVMGCSPILLVGMDCFRGGTYHDDPDATSSGTRIQLKSHLTRWQALGERLGADIRAAAGTLADEGIFPLHDPGVACAPSAPAPAALLFLEVGGLVVEFLKAWQDCRPLSYPPGGVHEISRNEQQRAHAKRATRLIGDAATSPELILETQPAVRA